MNYSKFEKRMIIFVLLSDLVFSGLTYWVFREALAFFPVCFGLFFVFLILTIGLLIDEYILPVKTFREISKNAIAVSFFWLSVVFLAVSGVRIGTEIISAPFEPCSGAYSEGYGGTYGDTSSCGADDEMPACEGKPAGE